MIEICWTYNAFTEPSLYDKTPPGYLNFNIRGALVIFTLNKNSKYWKPTLLIIRYCISLTRFILFCWQKSYWKTNKFSLFLAENPFLTIQHIQFNTFISAATSKLRTSLILVQIKICTSQLHFSLQWSSSILVAPRN